MENTNINDKYRVYEAYKQAIYSQNPEAEEKLKKIAQWLEL